MTYLVGTDPSVTTLRTSPQGETPLHLAAKSSSGPHHLAILQTLLAANPAVTLTRDRLGSTPSHRALLGAIRGIQRAKRTGQDPLATVTANGSCEALFNGCPDLDALLSIQVVRSGLVEGGVCQVGDPCPYPYPKHQ